MELIAKTYRHFADDSLYRNSIYLMVNTGILTFFGFFFWVINTRLFNTEQIGLATTMISVASAITSLSLFGLDIGIIRYLPRSERKSDQINTCFLAVIIIVLATITLFLLSLKTFSPRLLFIRENPYYTLLFVVFMVFSTASTFIDNIFIAFRDTKFILIKSSIFSVLKLILPFVLVSFGAYGIFGSWMTALTCAFSVSFIILVTKFKYKPQLTLDKNIIKEIGGFSFGNFVASFIGSLPVTILPLMITNTKGPETTAHYYMAMMVASLLFVIPQATTQSLFAEGSNNEEELNEHIVKSIEIISLILVPAIVVTFFFGSHILLVFGKNYSMEGFTFLQILALSGIFGSINAIFGTILRVKHEIKKLIFIGVIESSLILGLSYVFMSKGLLGIGLAWIIGQAIVSLIYSFCNGWGRILNFCIYFARKYKIPFIIKKQIWSIGIYVGRSPFSLAPCLKIKNPVLTAKDVTDAPAEFIADPFMVKDELVWHMFFEVFNKNTKRGEIGMAISDDGFDWKYQQIVLREPFHLSYPYVFKWGKNYYMIPETCETNSIRLYKAANFPTQWTLVKTMLEGKDFVDSSIFNFHGKWWLFTTSIKSNVLRLYYADDLAGSWIEHPKSPLISGNEHIARPGGRSIELDDYIIRYTQDDDPTYGNKVRAFKITELTTTSYTEEEIFENPILQANGRGWNGKGMHHIDPHQIEKDEWIACVDGHREIFRLGTNR